MRSVEFTVPGKPGHKGRAKATSKGGFVRMYTPKATRKWEAKVAEYARQVAPEKLLEGPLALTVVATFPMVKKPLKRGFRPWERKVTKPDLSNIVKSVEDAMNGIIYKDDSQISEYEDCQKIIACQGMEPDTFVFVSELE